MRLLIMADTHVPKRAKDLPAELWDEVARADVVVHAGDWVDVGLLDELEPRSARIRINKLGAVPEANETDPHRPGVPAPGLPRERRRTAMGRGRRDAHRR